MTCSERPCNCLLTHVLRPSETRMAVHTHLQQSLPNPLEWPIAGRRLKKHKYSKNFKKNPAAGARFSGDAGNRPENIFCRFHKSLPDGGFRYCENHKSLPNGSFRNCENHESLPNGGKYIRLFHESDTKVRNVYRHFHESDTKVENVYRHFHKLRQNGRNYFSKSHNQRNEEHDVHDCKISQF